MDGIQETPTKRRKLQEGDVSQTKGYDSANDSGEALFDNIDDFETVVTQPLPHRPTQHNSYVTQPTQIISPASRERVSVIQVTGSSPAQHLVPQSPTPVPRHGGGVLASAMAPPGTAFCLPPGISKAPFSPILATNEVVDLSSDGEDAPTYRGGSSDEDTQTARRADIKPSSFKSSVPPLAIGASNGINKFKSTLASSVYKPSGLGSKPQGSDFSGSLFDSRNRNEGQTKSQFASIARSADVMANAYGGSRSNRPVPTRPARQSGPAKAISSQDLNVDDIEDYQVRSKVFRMRNVLLDVSVLACFNALIKKRGNFDDAMDLLSSMEDQPAAIDLTLSDNEQYRSEKLTAQSSQQTHKKPAAKQQIKAPNQSIYDKWATAQKLSKPSQTSLTQASPPHSTLSKPRGRLIRGRRGESPHNIPSPKPSSPVSSPKSVADSDSDSGIDLESEETESDTQLLKFFNTCSISDLADIAAISEEVATDIISRKPFKSLDEVRGISDIAKSKGKKATKKPIGDKIVDKCQEMWTGYNAIDDLVERCAVLGDSVKAEMEKWGFNMMGSSSEGELDLADLNSTCKNNRDSGIGTPTSQDASVDEDTDGDSKALRQQKGAFFPQPSILAEGVVMKDYQVVGINWLSLLFDKGLSCILADDMGLGKTCQVIAFLAHLMEKKGVKGPHLIIVPGSTLENWLREFQTFCPQLNVMPYYAGLKERPDVREQIEENRESLNVIITTYTIAKAKDDNKFLRKLKPVCTIYDEGHLLRNSKSAGYDMYMRIPCQLRLLLTGTPLQNNLRELASLLGFILPSLFREHTEDLEAIFSHKAKTTDSKESHAALLSAQRIARAKTMMTPFVLRRKKHQVLKHLPQKHRRVQYCELSKSQAKIYDNEKARALSVYTRRNAGEKTGNKTSNVMMALRKASIHSLLFRQIYADETLVKMSKACLMEDELAQSDVDLVFEDMTVMTDMELHQFCDRYPSSVARFRLANEEWMDSGKVEVLAELLRKYKANGDRVLVFSQFVMVLNILEAVMETLDMQFFRLDGSTKIDERQDMIDQFYKEPEITVFLLSTGAGGAGINLACANKVIIFDSSFNPQSDIQAENRAHRVGQTREVEVVRLVTRGTIEEQIHALGETKLALDDRVAGVEENNAKAEKQGEKMVAEMMTDQIKAESVKDKTVAEEDGKRG